MARRFSMSASLMRSAASSAAMRSIPETTSNSSAISRVVIFATREPRGPSGSTKPSESSTRSASRSGVREMPKDSHSSASGNPLARRQFAFDDHVAQPLNDLLVQGIALQAEFAAPRGGAVGCAVAYVFHDAFRFARWVRRPSLPFEIEKKYTNFLYDFQRFNNSVDFVYQISH